MAEDEIRIVGARSHNLQGISCRIPLRALTVVTGVSGSGKSTLAFDTLYAEGQRRYVASLSAYARQFLERLPRPDVDLVSHLPPAIAIEQRNRVTNARSTVGTATEILDHLRLLFAKLGRTHCPGCGVPVDEGSVESVVDRLLAAHAGARLVLAAPLPDAGRGRRTVSAGALRDRLARDGWTRLLAADGRVLALDELDARGLAALRASASLVIDRVALSPGLPRARLAEAVASAFAHGGGTLVVAPADGPRETFRAGLVCDGCGRAFPKPIPALFSFNSPLGACQRCQGFGRTTGLDWERVIPDPGKSLAGGAIVPFQTEGGKACQRDLMRAARRLGIAVDAPFAELAAAHQEIVREGDGGDWYGVRGFFDWLEERRYKVQSRVLLARYRRYDPCSACGGARLKPDALAVRVGGRTIADVARLTIAELHAWLAGLLLAAPEAARSERLRAATLARVGTALDVGLGYLALERQTRTLSGGEAQRIQLATALGGTLTAALYVLDEPSIGLHASDVARLLGVLRAIRDQGNTVVVVEHAPEVVAAADHVIDLGPGAGRLGGRLVVEGDVAAVRAHPESLTGRALRGELAQARPRTARARRGALRIVGARAHNLHDLSVEIPLGQLVVVTGVSGAGKSTLVNDVLVGNLLRAPERGACERIEGAERVREIVRVDPTPPVRSARSNAATVSKAFDGIRKRFAATREAKALGAGPGWFSFNVAGGRCEACEGAGEVVVDMQFLDDVRVPCEACGGRRYRPEALTVRVDGRTVVDVLGLTIDEAAAAFGGDAAIAPRLEPFRRVGLGYLTLGQALSTLSGGESQRVRLALALADGAADALYVLDEPTTGLHPADVEVLLGCLEDLLAGGGSVLLVEHNLELIARADHVIDLGPEGGPGGGRLMAAGTPAEVAAHPTSRTAIALRAAGLPG